MIGAFVLGKAQKYKLPWRLLIVSFGAGCVLLALEIIWFRFLRLIGLTREDYPEYHDYLSITFSKVKQKPRVVEEHDSMAGILSAVEAGTRRRLWCGHFWLQLWKPPETRPPHP